MAIDNEARDQLIAEVCSQVGIPADLLKSLLELEEDFPDFTVWGTKTDFARRVADLIDNAAENAGAL